MLMSLNGNLVIDVLRRYGASVVVILIAFALTRLLWPFIQPAPVPLFFAAIFAAFWGGFGPGLFASIISGLIIDYAFVPPYNHFEWNSPNLVRIGVFITVSGLVSWLNTTRKKLMDERGRLLNKIEGFNEALRAEVETATQELSQTSEALLKTQQHLARSERMAVVGQMAASLAHEIGTPLNAISGHLELLAENKNNDSESRRRIRIIRQQLDFIVGTVRRLLEWTHKRELAFEPVNVEKLIKEVLWLNKPTLDDHSITANLVAEQRLVLVESDRESLQQVFLNLINNSIEAMPLGGEIEIITRVNEAANLAEIVFQDTGSGIRPDDVRHLFEPRWTTKASGSGFGLAIARETMMEHGGEIQVVAGRTVGAAFKLTLPISQIKTIPGVREDVMSHVA